MNNHSMLLALHELEGIGWSTINELRRVYPQLQDLMGASVSQLKELDIQHNRAELLASGLTEEYVRRTASRYQTGDIIPVTLEDPTYPELLLRMKKPPIVLYCRGLLDLLSRSSIAIVGTRNPTVYGKRMAYSFSRDLSNEHICVVSGLARGIDGMAHEGALEGPGGTIAVLGSGIDVIYPPEHANLYRSILEVGLIVSEYPPGMASVPGMFPMRNRIISGLSLGTLVVEAAERSGSLITADSAMEDFRDVFAIPGPLTSPKSRGALALIQQGAKLVMNVHDILSEYPHILEPDRIHSGVAANTIQQQGKLTEDELRVYTIIAENPITFDHLIERLQTNFGHLHAILLSLQMKKRIEQLPGSIYSLI